MKTALILGAAAVGAYLLIRHMQGASSIFGAPTAAPPAASGMTSGPTASSTPAGATMRTYARNVTRTGSTIVLGGIMVGNLPKRIGAPPSSFEPSSPGVSINTVTPPQSPQVTSTTAPTTPLTINPSRGLVPLRGLPGSGPFG